MLRLETPPSSIAQYREAGGELEFEIFEDADGTPDEVFAALCNWIPDCNTDALRAVGFRQIEDAQFYGDWFDPSSNSLLQKGFTQTGDAEFVDVRLADLEGARVVGSGGPIPPAGDGGQFAYAFSRPPYGISLSPKATQELFDKLRQFIAPPGVDHIILDWTSAELPNVSPYFEAGMEWWGVFLFSIYIPDYRRLTLIRGSATD